MPLAPLQVVRAEQARFLSPLVRWGQAVEAAEDACLLLDASGRIVAVSAAAMALLGCPREQSLGNRLLDSVAFLDFDTGEPAPSYASRVPPLLALSANSLARAIVRVKTAVGTRTLDVISTPLHASNGSLVGSLSFFAAVCAEGTTGKGGRGRQDAQDG
ncbi:MAG: PAS domain-containing protein [Mycobacteriales bacterium]